METSSAREGQVRRGCSGLLISVLPLLLGGTIPVANHVNLVWGSIYGLPGNVFHEARLPHPLQVDLLWIVVWPLVVTWALFCLLQWVRLRPFKLRSALVAAYLLSLCVVVPIDGILSVPYGESFKYEDWPLYVRLLLY